MEYDKLSRCFDRAYFSLLDGCPDAFNALQVMLIAAGRLSHSIFIRIYPLIFSFV